MKRNKLQKFAELLSFPNVYENPDANNPSLMAGAGKWVEIDQGWNNLHFKNDHPLVLELACGRGEYSLELARRYPNKNFIGVDIKGARIWKGAKIALSEGLKNVAFLRTRIEQLHVFFKPKEVSEIWITFPDPFTKKENRRLTSPRFLNQYLKMLSDNGIIHLKTDAFSLYEYTLEVLEQEAAWDLEYANPNIYKSSLENPDLDIKTYYELMHLEDKKKITYLRFRKSN